MLNQTAMPEQKSIEELHAEFKPKAGVAYDAGFGHIELEKGGVYFSVSIKEYRAAVDEIHQDQEKATKFIKSKVLSTEDYHKLTPQQRTTYDANIAAYNKNVARRRTEKTSLQQSFNEVCWVWQLVGNGTKGGELTLNEALGLGIEKDIAINGYRDIFFPALLEGGGMAWIEPFFKGKVPTGDIPHGLSVSATGSPDILDTIWTDLNNNPIADTEVQFGSCLVLHIYTKALYGQELVIGLIDRDLFDPNDQLQLTADSKIKDKFSFVKEVDVIKALPFEVGKPGVSGYLLDTGQDVNSKTFSSTAYVQKCKVLVFIDEKWKADAGGSLKIYPVIRSAATAKYFKKFPRKFLTITAQGKKYETPGVTGNNPILVNNIETNVAAFHPCGYSVINMKSNERDFEMFDQAKRIFEDTFEVVAGTHFTQQVTISLDEKASTADCRLEQFPDKKHPSHVLEIVSYPEKSISKKPGQAHSDFMASSTTKISVGGTSHKEKHIIFLDDIALEVIEKTDKKLTFLSRFIYDSRPVAGDLPWILRYIWMGSGSATSQYIIHVNSCRHTLHRLLVDVYPDIRWGLRFDWKNMKSENMKTTSEYFKNDVFDSAVPETPESKKKWKTPKKQKRSFGLTLKAKFNNQPSGFQLKGDKTQSAARNDGEEWDVSDDLSQKIEAALEPIDKLIEFLDKNFNGKNNKPGNTDQPSADHVAALEKVKNNPKNSFDLSKLNRAAIGVELYWPELAVELAWSRVAIKSKGQESLFNKTAVMIDGFVEAKPLIGIKAKLDFLALVQRAHPIALAIIAAADIIMSLIGDGSSITLELSATANAGFKLQGFINTATGENSFNKADREANSKGLTEGNVEILIKVTASVKLAMCKRVLLIVVNASLELAVEAEAKLYAKTAIDVDEHGIYLSPEVSFEGIQLKGKANIKADVGEADSDPLLKLDSKNEFVYQAMDRQPPVKMGKIYFNKVK